LKVHALEITGIGPYAETVEIDFDSLDEVGIYLLTGPTGSGKTTVLDAISYALFGSIPKQAKGHEVVSDHREISTTPRVKLEATIGGERYRITRSPAHEAPKVKGEGTKNEGQSLTVERRDSESWSQLTGAWTEGNDLLEKRVGMNSNQFNQVVLLPQGEFATFLQAKVGERKDLLMQLFPGADLEWLEKWMKQRAQEDREARDAKLEQIHDCFQAVKTTAESLVDEGEEALPRIGEATPALNWIEDGEGTLAKRHEERRAIRDAAAKEREQADLAVTRLNQKVERIAARKAAEEEKAELEKKAEWRKGTTAEIAAAEKAAGVRGYVRAAAELRGSADSARTKVTEATREIAANPLTTDLDSGEYSEAAKEFGERITTIINFESEQLPERRRLTAAEEELETEIRELSDQGPDSRIGKAEADVERAEENSTRATSTYVQIRETRTRGMAAELASQLKAGEPCAVCGSTEHPSPAHGEGEQYTHEQEEAARIQAEEAAGVHAETLTEANRIRTQVEARRAAATAELDTTRKSLKSLAAKEADLAGRAASVAERREELEAAVNLLTGFSDASKTANDAGDAAVKAEANAGSEATKAGFGSLEEAREASRDEATLTRLKSELSDHDERVALVRKQLEVDLVGVDPKEKVDLAPATEAAARAAAKYEEESEAAGVAENRLTTFRKETSPVAGYYEELGPLREAASCSSEMWRKTNGDNSKKMNLSIFVLATRLRQVIDAANIHLQGMSDQRYELAYTGDLEGHGAASGLGIEVFDAYTSESRPTSTLSGGETFYASLALALGLAEIVKRESGGKRLETLFIDEGFGSLDPESLDNVMDVIDSLREGGRSVGLVSHVEELKNRIAAKIVVTPSRDGSTLEVING